MHLLDKLLENILKSALDFEICYQFKNINSTKHVSISCDTFTRRGRIFHVVFKMGSDKFPISVLLVWLSRNHHNDFFLNMKFDVAVKQVADIDM